MVNLNYLEMQLPTIEVNQRNYQERLDCITKEANKFGETDLRFLAKFNQLAKQKYQIQIQEDHASLSPGLRVLENTIKKLRGIVEIEQAQELSPH